MPKLYLCLCYPSQNIIDRFKESYGQNHYLRKLHEFSLSLLIANDAKFSKNIQEKVYIERPENPYFSAVLSEPLSGNLSHMLRFMDVQFEEIESGENILSNAMSKIENRK